MSLVIASLLLLSGQSQSQMTVGHEPPPKPVVHHWPHPQWGYLPRTRLEARRCEQDRLITDNDPCSDNQLIRREKNKPE